MVKKHFSIMRHSFHLEYKGKKRLHYNPLKRRGYIVVETLKFTRVNVRDIEKRTIHAPTPHSVVKVTPICENSMVHNNPFVIKTKRKVCLAVCLSAHKLFSETTAMFLYGCQNYVSTESCKHVFGTNVLEM